MSIYVVSDWGHFGTARALQVCLDDLGWSPQDADEVRALLLTYMSDGHLGVSREDAQEARERARLPHIDTLGEEAGHDVFEALVSALDDAEAWLNEHKPAESGCACSFWGWSAGDWGLVGDEFFPYEEGGEHAADCEHRVTP